MTQNEKGAASRKAAPGTTALLDCNAESDSTTHKVDQEKSSNLAAAVESWRDELQIHPAADLFPMLAHDDLIALGEDIKKSGLQPVVVWSENPDSDKVFLLDGRNRLDAMEAVGLPIFSKGGDGSPQFEVLNRRLYKSAGGLSRLAGSSLAVDPFAYVISANIHRRHLTAEQKRNLIAKLLKAGPEQSDRQIAQQVKADHKTVARVREEQERRGEIPHVPTRLDTKGHAQPAERAEQARIKIQADRAESRAAAGDGLDIPHHLRRAAP